MNKELDIDGKKVKNICMLVQLEDGNGLATAIKPTEDTDRLRTLEDLQQLLSNTDDEELPKFQSPIVFAMDLREEAIKWVRDTNVAIKWLEENWIHNITLRQYQAVKNWIMYFFNLKEEDIK